jgi:hypothetical protein
MRARRTSRTRSRNAKFRRRWRGLAKLCGKLRPPMIANEETTDVERTPSLLLSSLQQLHWNACRGNRLNRSKHLRRVLPAKK